MSSITRGFEGSLASFHQRPGRISTARAFISTAQVCVEIGVLNGGAVLEGIGCRVE